MSTLSSISVNSSLGSTALGSITTGSSSTAFGSYSTGTYSSPSITYTVPQPQEIKVSIDPPSWSSIQTVEQTVVDVNNSYNNYNSGVPYNPPYGYEVLQVSAPYKKSEFDASKCICIVYGKRYSNEDYREQIKQEVTQANKTATEWIKAI